MNSRDRETGALGDTTFPASAASLADVRSTLRAVIGDELEPSRLAELLLVATELATNAIEASPGTDYRLAVVAGPKEITVRVSNYRPQTQLPLPEEYGPSHVLDNRGRGLHIVDTLADRLELSGEEDGWLHIEATFDRGH